MFTALTNPIRMFSFALFEVLPQHRTLRSIVLKRTVAVLCLALIMALATLWLGIDLDLWPLLSTLTLLVAFSAWTSRRMRNPRVASDSEVFTQLLVDISALSIMLYSSGGATNPFASLFLPDLAVAAALLSWRYVFTLGSLALIAYSYMFTHYVPLHLGDPDRAISYHLVGMWANFSMSAVLITWFVAGLSRTVRQRDAQLAQARLHHLQNDRLVALGIQAANTAHEMGTPLSTVAIIAGELLHEIDHAATTPNEKNEALTFYREEFATIETQIALCKAALDRMGKFGSDLDESSKEQLVKEWLIQFSDQWRLRFPTRRIELDLPAGDARIHSSIALAQILTTLLDNAAQAAATTDTEIRLVLNVTHKHATVTIVDQGPGIAPHLLPRLGFEPITPHALGSGIGLFLAYATARQIGAGIDLTPNPGGGTRASLTVPLV